MVKNRKGFTLIEVLIVVVIIAILAALLIPRMMGQVNRAISVEATQMIGTMRRIAEKNTSLGVEGTVDITTGETPWGNPEGTEADWASIGLKKPVSSNWTYYYWYYNDSVYFEYAGVAFYKTDPSILQYYYQYDGNEEYSCQNMDYIDVSKPLLGCKLR